MDSCDTHACKAFQDDFVAYLDGELAPEERATVSRHLAACPRCAAEIALFERTWSLLEHHQPIEPSSDFLHRLVTSFATSDAEPEAVRIAWLGVWLQRLAAAAAILVAFVAAQGLWRNLKAPDTPPQLVLSEEERAMIADLNVLADENFQLVRDLELVEYFPALRLDEQDLEAF
jgi:anti-sigma factor RsiW